MTQIPKNNASLEEGVTGYEFIKEQITFTTATQFAECTFIKCDIYMIRHNSKDVAKMFDDYKKIKLCVEADNEYIGCTFWLIPDITKNLDLKTNSYKQAVEMIMNL